MDKEAGYKNLATYIFATVIYDLTVQFCRRFISSRRQTEQMEQAARSDKSNIAEGYTFQSLETYIKLLGTACGSAKELGEDCEDFLRQRNLSLWPKDDPTKPTKRSRTGRQYAGDFLSNADLSSQEANRILKRKVYSRRRVSGESF